MPEDANPNIELGFNMALVCLIILLCFINVFGYLVVINFVKVFDLEKRYPRLQVFVRYFIRFSVTNIVIEAIIGFSLLIVLIILGFYPIFKII